MRLPWCNSCFKYISCHESNAVDAVHLEATAHLSSQCSMAGLPVHDDTPRRVSTPTTSRRSLSDRAPQRQVSLAKLLASQCSLSGGGAAPMVGGALASPDPHIP